MFKVDVSKINDWESFISFNSNSCLKLNDRNSFFADKLNKKCKFILFFLFKNIN